MTAMTANGGHYLVLLLPTCGTEYLLSEQTFCCCDLPTSLASLSQKGNLSNLVWEVAGAPGTQEKFQSVYTDVVLLES